jgi:hypothetical protein
LISALIVLLHDIFKLFISDIPAQLEKGLSDVLLGDDIVPVYVKLAVESL